MPCLEQYSSQNSQSTLSNYLYNEADALSTRNGGEEDLTYAVSPVNARRQWDGDIVVALGHSSL